MPEKPEEQATRLARAFVAAWSAHDAEAMGALFADDADFVNVTGLWWHGRGRIVRTHGTAFRTYFKDASLVEERLETRQLGANAAAARLRVRLEGQIGPDGSPSDARRAMLMLVCERLDEGWRIVAAQNTEIAAGSETMIATSSGAAVPVRYA